MTSPGTYNPDWAVLVEKDGEERLYFVVETKPSHLFGYDMRPTEEAKMKCGKAQFVVVDGNRDVKFKVPTTLDDLIADI